MHGRSFLDYQAVITEEIFGGAGKPQIPKALRMVANAVKRNFATRRADAVLVPSP